MNTKKFTDVVLVSKVSGCPSCVTFKYAFPFPINFNIEPYLTTMGSLQYPLSHIKTIKIENEYVSIRGYVGRNEIKFKSKQDPGLKALFDVQMAAYTEEELQIKIEL